MAVLINPTPLWAGKTFRVNSGVAVTVTHGVETIFSGKPRALPGASQGYAYMEVRDICAPFCRQSFDPQTMYDMLDGEVEALKAIPTESNALFTINGGGQNNVQFGFAADWSYRARTHSYGGNFNFLSDPVRSVIHPRMPVLVTSQYLSGTFEFMAGGSLVWSASVTEHSANNLLGAPVGWDEKEGEVFLRCGTATSPKWRQVEDCDAWALYYINAYGGWDWILIDGRMVRETASYTRSGGAVVRPLANVAARGWSTYLVEVERTWELGTDWLTDAEAARFALHVPGTPQAILHHIGTDDVYPVEVVTSEVQTARNVRSLASYTLTVRLARESLRM